MRVDGGMVVWSAHRAVRELMRRGLKSAKIRARFCCATNDVETKMIHHNQMLAGARGIQTTRRLGQHVCPPGGLCQSPSSRPSACDVGGRIAGRWPSIWPTPAPTSAVVKEHV